MTRQPASFSLSRLPTSSCIFGYEHAHSRFLLAQPFMNDPHQPRSLLQPFSSQLTWADEQGQGTVWQRKGLGWRWDYLIQNLSRMLSITWRRKKKHGFSPSLTEKPPPTTRERCAGKVCFFPHSLTLYLSVCVSWFWLECSMCRD